MRWVKVSERLPNLEDDSSVDDGSEVIVRYQTLDGLTYCGLRPCRGFVGDEEWLEGWNTKSIDENLIEQKWRVPTDADKGKACKCWDDSGDHNEGRFVAIFDNGFLTTSSKGFMIWDHCQVLDD